MLIAILLTLSVSVYIVEMSGRWDHSIQDANDEAGFVAIVLCVGLALSIAATLVARIRASRATAGVVMSELTRLRRDHRHVALARPTISPPLPLRL